MLKEGHPRFDAPAVWPCRRVASATAAMILMAVTFLAAPPSPAMAAQAPSQPEGGASWDPGTVIVRYRSELSISAIGHAAADRGLRVLRTVGATGGVLVSTEGRAPTEIVQQLGRDPRVATAELNHRRRMTGTPNDPMFGSVQQYLSNLGLPAAWDRSQGSASLKIAVVDTGVDLDHPDLLPVLSDAIS